MTDTALKTGGGGVVGAFMLYATLWLRERFAPKGDDAVEQLRKELGAVKTQISDLSTQVALGEKQGRDNEKAMDVLRGEFHAMSTSVQLTMNQVQSHLSDMNGYMRGLSEARLSGERRRTDPPTP